MLFSLSIFYQPKLLAQQYHPLVVDGAKWNDVFIWDSYFVGGSFTHIRRGYSYTLLNDTIINSNLYKLISYQRTWYYEGYNGGSEYSNYDLAFPENIFGAIREDSSKKIWFKNFYSNPPALYNYYGFSPPADTEILLYDFNIQLQSSTPMGTVLSIDSIMLNDSTYRKRYNFQPAQNPYYLNLYNYWIEGIGSSLGLFGPYSFNVYTMGNLLSCYNNGNENLLYIDSNFNSSTYNFLTGDDHYFTFLNCDSILCDCPEITGFNEIKSISSSLNLFPNPASNQLIIQTKLLPGDVVEVKDLTGRTVLSEKFNRNIASDYFTIDIHSLTSSVYFISLKQIDGSYLIEKFIKD